MDLETSGVLPSRSCGAVGCECLRHRGSGHLRALKVNGLEARPLRAWRRYEGTRAGHEPSTSRIANSYQTHAKPRKIYGEAGLTRNEESPRFPPLLQHWQEFQSVVTISTLHDRSGSKISTSADP